MTAGGTVGGAITVAIRVSISQAELADEPAFHSCAHAQRTQCSTVEILTHPFPDALFTVARKWNHPRSPSADEWLMKI